MINLHELQADNILTFKKLRLPLDKYPLIVVRGKNLDSRSKQATNGVGKSLAYALIPTLRYGAPPSAERSSTNNARKGSARELHAGSSKIALSLTNHNKYYNLIQFQKGKSVAYDVEVHNKPLKFRKAIDAQEKIAKIFPVNDTQFSAFTYIDAHNFQPLQRGNSAQRFAFFENIFNLDVLDKISDKINKRYNAIKFESQKLKETQSELELLEQQLPIRSLQELKEKQINLAHQANKVKNKVENYLNELRYITAFLTVSEGFDRKSFGSREDLQKELQEMLKDEVEINKSLKDSIAYYAHIKHTQKVVAERKDIKKQLEKLEDVSIDGLDSLNKKNNAIQSKLHNLKRDLENKSTEWKQKQKLAGKIKEFALTKEQQLKYTDKKCNSLKEIIANNKFRIKEWQSSIETLTEHHNEKCPTCFQKLSIKIRNNIITSSEENIKQAKLKIIKCTNLINKITDYLEVVDEYKNIAVSKYDIMNLQDTLDSTKIKSKKLETLIEKIVKKKNLLQALQHLPLNKVKERKVTRPEAYEDLLVGLHERISTIKKVLDKIDQIKKLKVQFDDYNEANLRYKKLQSYIKKYRPLLEKAQNALQNYSIKVARQEALEEQIRHLKAKIKIYTDTAKDFKIYECLRKSYSAGGLRQMRISEIAAQFEELLNRYAPLIFWQKIIFKIVVTSNKLDILATRNDNKTADVRSLSGAERKAFILLSLISLLPFVPSSSRTNLVILDEIEAGLDEPSLQRFINEFIPVLQSIIPNIVVITPQSEKKFYIPNAVEFTIVKQNNVSTLEIKRAA